MDTSVWMLYALGVLGLVATINATLSFIINVRILRHNNRLIKAVIANNVAEYAGAEETPEEHIKVLKEENKLAMVAGKLQPHIEPIYPLG